MYIDIYIIANFHVASAKYEKNLSIDAGILNRAYI